MPRRPDWPGPWLELAVLFGGSVALREALGYHSKTTLSAKIADPSKWRRADLLLLAGLTKRQPNAPRLTSLVDMPVLEKHLSGAELIDAGVVVF